MSDREGPAFGTIAWTDITVKDAGTVRDVYREVVGWSPEPVEMGGCNGSDTKAPGGGGTVAGAVCALYQIG